MGEPNPNLKSAPAGRVSIGRILLLVVPLALIVLGLFFGYSFGALSFLDELFKPPLVQAKGVVYWNGEVLRGGSIETQHEKEGVRGAGAIVGIDGTFTLETLVNGEIKKGAYAGKHKVTVRQNDRTVTMVFAQPPAASPEKYLDFATTDLVINIERDAANNDFRLDLKGTGPKGQNNSKEEREAAEAAAKAAKAKEKKLSSDDLAKKIIEDADEDKDGKISKSEQSKVPAQYQRGLPYVDTNKDDFLDFDEIRSMFPK